MEDSGVISAAFYLPIEQYSRTSGNQTLTGTAPAPAPLLSPPLLFPSSSFSSLSLLLSSEEQQSETGFGLFPVPGGAATAAPRIASRHGRAAITPAGMWAKGSVEVPTSSRIDHRADIRAISCTAVPRIGGSPESSALIFRDLAPFFFFPPDP